MPDMPATRRRRRPRPGENVRFEFATRVVEGMVTSVRGDYMHVSVQLVDVDEPIDHFVRIDSMVPA